MIPAVILAAGASTRMGRSKALLPASTDGETFLARLLRTFSLSGADDIVVVVGPSSDEIAEAIGRLPVSARVVENRAAERGQLSSLVAAIDVVDRPGVRAVMVMPVDTPLVEVSTVRTILEAYQHQPHLVVRPASGGRHGHPVIFDRRLFHELRHGDFSVGARAVIAAHRDDILDVPVHDPGAFQDIDTPEDYGRYIGLPFPGAGG